MVPIGPVASSSVEEPAGRPWNPRRVSPTSLVIHAHFYQPPRENPWTEEVPREPSARPFHDWNARISSESYRPNAFARIFDADGRVLSIVNNYEELSFNVGPTLMSWLERYQPDVYGRIQDAEAGGGAIAQAWNHMILPLGQRARRPHPDSLGPGRLPAPVRPGGAGNVAAGDGGERRRAGRPGRGGRRLHHPRPGSDGGHQTPRRADQPVAGGRAEPGLDTDRRRPPGRHPGRLPVRPPPARRASGSTWSCTTAGCPTPWPSRRSAARPWSTGWRPPPAAGAGWCRSPSTARPSATTTSGPTGRWPTP